MSSRAEDLVRFAHVMSTCLCTILLVGSLVGLWGLPTVIIQQGQLVLAELDRKQIFDNEQIEQTYLHISSARDRDFAEVVYFHQVAWTVRLLMVVAVFSGTILTFLLIAFRNRRLDSK